MKKTLLIVPLVGLALFGGAMAYQATHRESHQAELRRCKDELTAYGEIVFKDGYRQSAPGYTPTAEESRRLAGEMSRYRELTGRFDRVCAEYDCNQYTMTVKR
jgi:hypothetical protein